MWGTSQYCVLTAWLGGALCVEWPWN